MSLLCDWFCFVFTSLFILTYISGFVVMYVRKKTAVHDLGFFEYSYILTMVPVFYEIYRYCNTGVLIGLGSRLPSLITLIPEFLIFNDFFRFEWVFVEVLFPQIQFLKLLACVLLFLGYCFYIWGLYSMKDNWGIGIPTKDENKKRNLVKKGAFQYSRNPIYVHINVYFISLFLMYPNCWFCGTLVCVIALIHYQIKKEEAFLKELFGIEYKNYLKSVRRYI